MNATSLNGVSTGVKGFELRPYQQDAVRKVHEAWDSGSKRVLGIAPTGSGKTRIFSRLVRDRMDRGRVLILAHQKELIEQAQQKLYRDEGIYAEVEKAEHRARLNAPVVVGSIQTLMGARRERFGRDHFATVIHDESHLILAESHQSVVNYFDAQLFGCTATPHRTDRKNLGSFFDTVGFELFMNDLIQQGYLAPIVAKSLPIQIDLKGVRKTVGDFNAADLEDALYPMLEATVEAVLANNEGRKTLVFLPLIKTAKLFSEICKANGVTAEYVSGECSNRAEKLAAYARGDFQILSNSQLLTTGFDDPSIACVVILRPTQSWTLYVQCVGRGTRIYPGKENLLLLDPLWLVEKHSLIKPARLIASSDEEAERIDRIIESGGKQIDLFEARELAALQKEQEDKQKIKEHEREASLRKAIQFQSNKGSKLVDPIMFALSIDQQAAAEYASPNEYDWLPVTDVQKGMLERSGIDVASVKCKGHASQLIDTIVTRRKLNLATPKQLRWLIHFGYPNAHAATFPEASAFLDTKFKR